MRRSVRICKPMADTIIHGHDSTMNNYVDHYYDNESQLSQYEHFYPPVLVPNQKNMMIHVWETGIYTPLFKNSTMEILRNVLYFSIYENGTIINPENDERFKPAYLAHIAYDKKPWIECYFDSYSQIKLFLKKCDILQ